MEKFCIGIKKINDITYGSELILDNFAEIVKGLIRTNNLCYDKRSISYVLIKGD
jgi:hypothetical protein